MNEFAKLTHPIKLAVGSIGPCFSEAASSEVWEFVINETLKGKYESVAEYLVDLAIEESFRNK
jgi:hypothetical protein